jgi:hypothetical protein
MSNIENAYQTNQSMILHLFIKVDINDNQIANTYIHEDTKVNKILMHVSHNDLNK